jgi:uncharacterized RDD family membrane protein YckC
MDGMDEATVEPRNGPQNGPRYAGFWRRFGAYWLDVLVMAPVTGLFLWVMANSRLGYAYLSLPAILLAIYLNVFFVVKYGGTPGKLLAKIRIVKLDGSPVGFDEAAIRYSVMCILGILSSLAMVIAATRISDAEYLDLGFTSRSLKMAELAPSWNRSVNIVTQIWIWGEFIVMLTNKRRRAVHDFMAGTIVVRAE